MNKNIFKMSLALFSLCFVTSGAFAEDFSADMVNTVGKQIMQSKLYISGDKIRMDMKEGVMIIRNDKKISWMLMPSEKMYMENPIDMSRVPKTSKSLDAEIDRTSLGMETIDGKQAEKFKVNYKENGQNASVYQWLVNKEIPIKVEAVDGSWSMEYKNLSLGAQPADLFEVPAGYSKMTMPSLGNIGMGMMGGH